MLMDTSRAAHRLARDYIRERWQNTTTWNIVLLRSFLSSPHDEEDPSLPGKRESDIDSALGRLQIFPAASGDYDMYCSRAADFPCLAKATHLRVTAGR